VVRDAKYLRNARHLNKFMFILSDELFYEPFESCYQSSNEYIDLVADLLKHSPSRWTTIRDGLWMNVYPSRLSQSADEDPEPLSLPVQGWKVHVSATLSNDSSVLREAAQIALANGVPFKFALDRNILSLMSSKAWPRSKSGKFITLYPADNLCFESLLEQLYTELRSFEGPYILSDRRYKDCRVLYYRYGGIRMTTRLDITGGQIPVLISPDGTAMPDVRTPYFDPPPWVADPFPREESKDSKITLNAGRYLVKKALAFSNSGGVYLAEDRNTGAEIVIKEARPYALMDRPGSDAVKLLEKEQAILEVLRDTGITAEPLESFRDWENFFLAEEYIIGMDVREIMLTRSPLLRVQPSLHDSQEYYDIFRRLVSSLARGLNVLHDRDIIFGDLSANNLKVDPSTWAVRLLDLEGAFRSGIDNPAKFYTPGFKSEASIRRDAQGFDEDLYSLATIMLYMIFPVSALGSLRDDLFDTVLRTILADVGWSQTEVFNIIRGLSKNEITCARVCELLDKPVQILPPSYSEEIEPHFCDNISRELGNFILTSMRADAEGSLFPADPFVHQTNYLSLGFGACGVLYVLRKCGFEIPTRAYHWLERQLDTTKPEDLAPGLLTGASGIAWCLWDLGFEDRATELIKIANESDLLKSHHSYLYGMAGVGMANLYLYIRTKEDKYLAAACHLAELLCKMAKENDRGIYWEDSGVVQLGFGYGQSGVALFFLRLFELTGDEELLAKGRCALEFDLSHGIKNEDGVSFPCVPADPTLLTYLEEGSAGIAKVAIRYNMWERTEGIFSGIHRKYAVFAGLLYGLGSFVDVLTDAFLLSGNRKFLEMATRPISGIRDLYLIKQPCGLATPGDGLFRISCDYATGVAGVLRALHRFSHLEEADFVLDEVAFVPGQVDEVPRGGVQLQALLNIA
jgi:hypothetical protein